MRCFKKARARQTSGRKEDYIDRHRTYGQLTYEVDRAPSYVKQPFSPL